MRPAGDKRGDGKKKNLGLMTSMRRYIYIYIHTYTHIYVSHPPRNATYTQHALYLKIEIPLPFPIEGSLAIPFGGWMPTKKNNLH